MGHYASELGSNKDWDKITENMNTLKARTVDREGYTWGLDVQEVRGHTPYSRKALVRRNGELWATALLKHDGKVKVIAVNPWCKLPDSVLTEIKKDLNVQNS